MSVSVCVLCLHSNAMASFHAENLVRNGLNGTVCDMTLYNSNVTNLKER
jgi:hypothetical protein